MTAGSLIFGIPGGIPVRTAREAEVRLEQGVLGGTYGLTADELAKFTPPEGQQPSTQPSVFVPASAPVSSCPTCGGRMAPTATAPIATTTLVPTTTVEEKDKSTGIGVLLLILTGAAGLKVMGVI